MITENITFANNKGEKLSGNIYRTEKTSPLGVIFCHGLFSGKDAYKIVKLAPDIVAAGFTLMTFNFSFIEKNSLNTISIFQEVRDLQAAINYFHGRGIASVHLIGSSMGGIIATIFASQSPYRLASLVAIATPLDLSKLVQTMTGVPYPASIANNGTTMIDDIAMHNSFFIEALSIEMLPLLKNISLPILVIHGRNDDVVDVANVELFRKEAHTAITAIIIENGNHNLVKDHEITILRDTIVQWLVKGHKE